MPKPAMVPGATQTPFVSSEGDDDEMDTEGEESLLDSIKTEGMSEEYTGQVKNLVKMFEKFAKNVNDGNKAGKKDETIATTKTGKGLTLSNNLNGSSTPAMSAKDSLPASAEQRLSQLESKMSAVVAFVSELVSGEIDVLGSNYIHQVNTEKNIDILKTCIDVADDELDEVHKQLEEVEAGVLVLKQDNKMIQMKMKQLEECIQTGSDDLRGLVTDIEKNVEGLFEMVERISETVGRLFPSK